MFFGIVFVVLGLAAILNNDVAKFVIMDNRIASALLKTFTDGDVSESTFKILKYVCSGFLIVLGILSFILAR